MPKLLYDVKHNSNYLLLPAKLINGMRWKAGDMIKFVYDEGTSMYLMLDKHNISSSSKLVYHKQARSYSLVVPLALVNYYQWDIGRWFKFIFYNEKDNSIWVNAICSEFDRAEDKACMKYVIDAADRTNTRKEKDAIADAKHKQLMDRMQNNIERLRKLSGA